MEVWPGCTFGCAHAGSSLGSFLGREPKKSRRGSRLDFCGLPRSYFLSIRPCAACIHTISEMGSSPPSPSPLSAQRHLLLPLLASSKLLRFQNYYLNYLEVRFQNYYLSWSSGSLERCSLMCWVRYLSEHAKARYLTASNRSIQPTLGNSRRKGSSTSSGRCADSDMRAVISTNET